MNLIVGNRACGILYRYVKYIGGKWLLPANVCPVVPFTFVAAKVAFDFVDIDKQTLCIDEEIVRKKIQRDKTIKGVLYVHTYGSEQDIDAFVEKIRNKSADVKIVDDRCLCRPEITSPDTSANVVLYSTGYAKYLDLGGGGYAWMQDGEKVYSRATIYEKDTLEEYFKGLQVLNRQYIHNEAPKHWLDTTIEKNLERISRYFDTIQIQLIQADCHKHEINDIYRSISTHESLGTNMNNWRYSLLVDRKEEVLSTIFSAGLFASSHYCPSSRLFTQEHYPNSEWLYSHIINLFNDKYISPEQARQIVAIINAKSNELFNE